jgi:hypothetical protein
MSHLFVMKDSPEYIQIMQKEYSETILYRSEGCKIVVWSDPTLNSWITGYPPTTNKLFLLECLALLKIGPIGCPGTSLSYQSTPCNIPDKRRSLISFQFLPLSNMTEQNVVAWQIAMLPECQYWVCLVSLLKMDMSSSYLQVYDPRCVLCKWGWVGPSKHNCLSNVIY